MGYLSAREAGAAQPPSPSPVTFEGPKPSTEPARHRWCILRTGGNRTVPLAQGLGEAGYATWTPTETRRVKLAGKVIDRPNPILPTFVFAGAAHVEDLVIASQDPRSHLPGFTVFRHRDRVALIGDTEILALREAEELAALRHACLIEGEAAEHRRQARVAELKRAAARRKALRAQPLGPLKVGTWVEIDDAPALAGLTGQIVEERGNAAVVMFGGTMRMTIEAWQIVPAGVDKQGTRTA